MENKNSQGGFAPLIIIAIVAILAIGGGAYIITKDKSSDEKVEDGRRGDVQFEDKMQAEAEINLDVNAKGSLRSLLGGGKNMMCTFASAAGGTNSSGTVYISSDGSMRGDFSTETSAGTQMSSMIVKNDTSYVWSGTQGVKMNVAGDSTTSSDTKSDVDLDSQVDYKCANWSKDESKFSAPTSVNFLDVEAMMKVKVQ
ncbi:MAG: hypothetical protein WAX80_02515 [Minisyncoccia bacterium]